MEGRDGRVEEGRVSGGTNEKKKKAGTVYSQSSELWVGLEEEFWKNLEFVSVHTAAGRKEHVK